jgi:hypothetical protein
MFLLYITPAAPVPSFYFPSHRSFLKHSLLPFTFCTLASDSVSGSRCSLLRPIALYFPYHRVLRTNFAIDSPACGRSPLYISSLRCAGSCALDSSQSVRRCAMRLTHCPSRGQFLPPAFQARMRGLCRFCASIPPHQPLSFISTSTSCLLILFSIDPRVVHPPGR